MNAANLWTEACAYLKGALNHDVYSRWIETIKPVSIDNDYLILHVDNEFCRDWLENHYKTVIIDALRVSGVPQNVEPQFKAVGFDNLAPDQNTALAAGSKTDRQQPVKKRYKNNSQHSNDSLNPNFTFENFVTGQSNSFAHAAALAVSQAPGRAYNPLFIYGETGIGKTHLMQAIGHRALLTPGMQISYVSLETLLNEFIESIRNTTTVEFRAKYRKTDVLLVDDIQFLQGKDSLQDEFFHTFNVLYDAHKQIILTSDLPPRELKGLEPRLVSRFEWGLVTQIESPDFETRLAILRYKQSLGKVKLSDDIMTFIADNIKSNVRSLEGALNRAISFITLNPLVPLSLDILRNLLKDQLDNEKQTDISFDDIQRTVADYFNLRLSDMSSKRRPRSVATPRQIAMFLCHKLTRASLPEIAKAFDKTHPTIMHANKTVHGRMQVEDDFRNTIRQITRKLGRNPEDYQI